MVAPIVVPAIARHTATIIILHGLGDSGLFTPSILRFVSNLLIPCENKIFAIGLLGAGWAPVAQMLNSQLPHVKWILPSATDKPVSLNFGMRMPSWFDITGLSPDSKEDEDGIKAAGALLNSLVDEEIAEGTPVEVMNSSVRALYDTSANNSDKRRE